MVSFMYGLLPLGDCVCPSSVDWDLLESFLREDDQLGGSLTSSGEIEMSSIIPLSESYEFIFRKYNSLKKIIIHTHGTLADQSRRSMMVMVPFAVLRLWNNFRFVILGWIFVIFRNRGAELSVVRNGAAMTARARWAATTWRHWIDWDYGIWTTSWLRFW